MQSLGLVLASASPRRRELLEQIGLRVEVCPSGLDEDGLANEDPRQRVRRLAVAKGRAVAERLARRTPPPLIVAADTEVVLDGRCLGKPRDREDARAMLRRLRNREHHVLTGVWLAHGDGRHAGGVASTEVRFRDFDEAWLGAYVASGEPLDKAGAYGIQGRGALLVQGIRGSWSNVVGFPLERLPGWLEELGLDPQRLWPSWR